MYCDNCNLETFREPKENPSLYERIRDYKEVPFCAGVYFAYDNKKILSYIGFSRCLGQRVGKRFTNQELFILRFKSSKLAKIAERLFLWNFRPYLNKRLY